MITLLQPNNSGTLDLTAYMYWKEHSRSQGMSLYYITNFCNSIMVLFHVGTVVGYLRPHTTVVHNAQKLNGAG